jgi:hypothetical protein
MKGMKNQRALLIASVLLVLTGGTAGLARTVYVDANAPGADNGASWEDAYNFLQDALADANSSDKPIEIRVAQGTYTPDRSSAAPDGTGDRMAFFKLRSGVALRGGYAGFGRPDPDARDIAAYETILSGDLDGNDAGVADPCDLPTEPTRSENSYHVLTGSNTDPNALLEGFTVTGGNANGTLAQGYANYGGGMFNIDGSPTLAYCTFRENSAGTLAEGGSGGGIENESYSMPKINLCTFSRNYAVGTGGGIGNYRSAPTLNGCTFTGNRANGGAAVENSLDTGLAPTTLTKCAFLGNTAERYAGGVYNGSSSPTMVRCLFAGNSVRAPQNGVGGAMANWKSSPALMNCTFTENRANRRGAAMENSEGSAILVDCILWANSPGWEDGELTGGSNVVIVYSDVQGGWPGEGNVDADPCFAAPGYWDTDGTPDDANDDFWVTGDYHVKSQAGRWDPNSLAWVCDDATSPCIDTGDPEEPRGAELHPHGWRINMGIYGGTGEASMSLCPVGDPADCSNDGTVDLEDLFMLADRWSVQGILLAEDVNRDGIVDFADFAIMASHWLQTVSGSCAPEVFAEGFELDGWDDLWTQDSQEDWFRSGLNAADERYSAKVDGRAEDATLTSVPIDLEGKTCASISFLWYIDRRFDEGEYLAFDVSTDGGISWVQKASFDGNSDEEGDWQFVVVKLTKINSLQLRFRAYMSSSNEDAYVDAVSVVASYH